jgi:hypothetical protein
VLNDIKRNQKLIGQSLAGLTAEERNNSSR